MDVWFCEDRNHAERRLMRAEMIFRDVGARSQEARLGRGAFLLDKDLHGCRKPARCPIASS